MISIHFQYKPIFEVAFEHNYFHDGLWHSYDIVPDNQTMQLCREFDMLYKRTEKGFVLLMNELDSDKLQILFDKIDSIKPSLTFWVVAKDAFFYNYTNVGVQNINQLYRFSNCNLGDKTEGLLHASKCVTDADVLSAEFDSAEISRPKNIRGNVIGFVDLTFTEEINKQVLANLINEELTSYQYTIAFEARKAIWRYLINSSNPEKLKSLKINSKSEGISFLPETKEVKDGREFIVFESKKELVFQQLYDYEIQLTRGGKKSSIIKKRMQFASPESLIPRGNDNENFNSDILIYI